jgi:endonuclease/exonuclease/phosphatase family metal-dependent hydrolase
MRPALPPARAFLALIAAAAASACAPLNYTHPVEPYAVHCCRPAPAAPESLRVVTFNIRFAREIPRAIATLRDAPELAGADIVLLQEMDAPSTARVARALGMNAVYYPAVRHPSSRRDFGNAVLSRHPILRHRKHLLPHPGRFGRTRRIAVSAVLDVGGRTVAVTSTHLATPIENGPRQRRAQLEAIARASERFVADLVIVGGDLNDPGLARRMIERGFACPTRGRGATSVNGLALDHLFVRRRHGADAQDGGAPAGVRGGDRVTSDHYPVWALIPLDPGREDAGS